MPKNEARALHMVGKYRYIGTAVNAKMIPRIANPRAQCLAAEPGFQKAGYVAVKIPRLDMTEFWIRR
jgi:hypothetical protein